MPFGIWNALSKFGDLSCAVVISAPDLRESMDDADEGADDKVVAYWNRMMQRYGSADDYEEAIKAQYHAGELDLVIVCSKWLTGFDEPLCQVLYLDKELKEHGLLQANCPHKPPVRGQNASGMNRGLPGPDQKSWMRQWSFTVVPGWKTLMGTI